MSRDEASAPCGGGALGARRVTGPATAPARRAALPVLFWSGSPGPTPTLTSSLKTWLRRASVSPFLRRWTGFLSGWESPPDGPTTSLTVPGSEGSARSRGRGPVTHGGRLVVGAGRSLAAGVSTRRFSGATPDRGRRERREREGWEVGEVKSEVRLRTDTTGPTGSLRFFLFFYREERGGNSPRNLETK